MNLDAFLQRHALPATFTGVVERYYRPLAGWLRSRSEQAGSAAFVLGINGAQGTGKSTLSHFLRDCLHDDFGLSVAELSIDDLYLTRAERADLARRVHPLLATRGVPGTHDAALGLALMDRLRALPRGESLRLPRFDKATDDRCPPDAWAEVRGPVDVLIFEGWCVGSRPEPAEHLAAPVNRLEAEEDPDGRWRGYVNEQLATAYRALFERIDALVFLRAPGFAAIRRWRLEQERKLAAASGGRKERIMDEQALLRFMQHYERITRAGLDAMPGIADVVLTLGEDHSVESATCSPADRPALPAGFSIR